MPARKKVNPVIVDKEQVGVTEREGITYVSTYAEPFTTSKDITARRIYELKENMLLEGSVYQMANLIISGDVRITVYDEEDNVIEDLSRELNLMFSRKSCSLNAICRSAIQDLFIWGISIYNWVWVNLGNKVVCKEIHRLNPYNFAEIRVKAPTKRVYGRLLKGIYYDYEDDKIHYMQNDPVTRMQVEVDSKNLFVVRDGTSDYPDGKSVLLPVAQIADFSNFAWNTLGQQMYRTGAPIMFIKITNPVPSRMVGGRYIEGDVEYANQILANWGKDTPYVLRENMEVVNVNVTEGALSIRALDKAGEMVKQYISPVGMLGKDGTLISGNTDAALRLVNNNIRGWVNLLENQLSELPNYYLRSNSYPAGWYAKVEIPATQIEDTNSKLQVAGMMIANKLMTPNEVRVMFGMEGVGDDELIEIGREWDLLNGGGMKGEEEENPMEEGEEEDSGDYFDLGDGNSVELPKNHPKVSMDDLNNLPEGHPRVDEMKVIRRGDFVHSLRKKSSGVKKQNEIADKMKSRMRGSSDELLGSMLDVLRGVKKDEDRI